MGKLGTKDRHTYTEVLLSFLCVSVGVSHYGGHSLVG